MNAKVLTPLSWVAKCQV